MLQVAPAARAQRSFPQGGDELFQLRISWLGVDVRPFLDGLLVPLRIADKVAAQDEARLKAQREPRPVMKAYGERVLVG